MISLKVGFLILLIMPIFVFCKNLAPGIDNLSFKLHLKKWMDLP